MFINFPPSWGSVMRKEENISMINCIWRFDIKRWSRDMFRVRQFNLPDGLLYQPKLCNVLRHSSFFSLLFKRGQPFPKAFRTSRFFKVFFPFCYSLQETIDNHSQSQGTSNNVDNFTLLLRSTRLVEVEKPWFPQIKILIMHLIVKFQSVIDNISP